MQGDGRALGLRPGEIARARDGKRASGVWTAGGDSLAGMAGSCGRAGRPRPFGVLKKPSSQKSKGGFLQPLVEQGDDFLAQVGGVVESGQFEALERRGRGQRKVFRRGIGASGHGHILLSEWCGCAVYHKIQYVKQKYYGTPGPEGTAGGKVPGSRGSEAKWRRGVGEEEGSGKVGKMCSACAGDYENPEMTARGPDEEERQEEPASEGDKGESREGAGNTSQGERDAGASTASGEIPRAGQRGRPSDDGVAFGQMTGPVLLGEA